MLIRKNRCSAISCVTILIIGFLMTPCVSHAEELHGASDHRTTCSSAITENKVSCGGVGTDQAQRDIEEAEFLKKIKEFDAPRYEQDEYPKEKLAAASTAELLTHYLNSPATTLFILHGDDTGIKRAFQVSWTLQEIIKREDFAQSVIGLYQTDEIYPLDPNKVLRPGQWEERQKILKTRTIGPPQQGITIESFAYGIVSMRIAHRNRLLMYPPCFRLLAGHERALLRALTGCALRMIDANAKHFAKTGKIAYSYSLTSGKSLALALAEKTDPTLYHQLMQTKNIEAFYKTLDKEL